MMFFINNGLNTAKVGGVLIMLGKFIVETLVGGLVGFESISHENRRI